MDSTLVAAGLAAIHIGFAFVEGVVFPWSKNVQFRILGKHFESKEALEMGRFLLLNMSFYNAMTSALTLYGVKIGSAVLILSTMLIYIANGVAILCTSPDKYISALIRVVPAVVVLFTFEDLKPHTPVSNMPGSMITFAPVMHILFFILESLMVRKSKQIQRLFLGRLSSSAAAVDTSINILFRQGIYNLGLALAAFYAILMAKDKTAVNAYMMVYVGAAVGLALTIPRGSMLYRGAIVQGLPAIVALFVNQ